MGKRGPKPKNPVDLFWSHVDKCGALATHVPNLSRCWEWCAARGLNGYGHFHVRGKDVYAHRFSYMIHYEKIPAGKMILHRCDNRACVNPDHLFIGTARINTEDMHAKKRWRPGNKPARVRTRLTKLTIEDVRKIRQMVEDGMQQKSVAIIFKVSRSVICGIISNKTWREE